MRLERSVEVGGVEKRRDGRELGVLGVAHGSHHGLDVLEAGLRAVLAHDLPQSPGGALEGRGAVLGDGAGQPVVLVRSSRSVTTGFGIADVAIVEPASRQAVEVVPLVEDLGSPVGQEAAPGGLHGQNGPDLRRLDVERLSDRRKPGPG